MPGFSRTRSSEVLGKEDVLESVGAGLETTAVWQQRLA